MLFNEFSFNFLQKPCEVGIILHLQIMKLRFKGVGCCSFISIYLFESGTVIGIELREVLPSSLSMMELGFEAQIF